MPKWIEFIEEPLPHTQPNRKTKIYSVVNKQYGSTIGVIQWYGPFRKYSFFPNHDTVYEQDCLQDILNFIRELEHVRKGGDTPRVRLSEYGIKMQGSRRRKWFGRVVETVGDSVRVQWYGRDLCEWMDQSQVESI
jgi:hypothetical protein